MNIVQTIRQETRSFAHKTAIVEGERTISYEQLLQRVADLRQILADRQIGPGRRIAFHCGDGIDYVIGALALLECGAAVVPAPGNVAEREVVETIERIDVQGILVHAAVAKSRVEQSADRLDDTFFFQSRHAATEYDDRCREMGAAFIRFSSGTTGESKGVVLSHRAIIDRTDAANRGLGVTDADVILWVLAMSYHFVVSILLFLRKGATIVIANQFFPFSLIDAARRFPITFIYASPVHYHLLGVSDAVSPAALAGVRLAISTSMKMPLDISARFAKKFGFLPTEAYGIIEIGLPFINTRPDPAAPNTVGHVLPDYTLRIANPDPAGIGEVLIRGKGMFDAYFSPWRPRDFCTDDGFFHTGDLGRLDDQGRLSLLGRSKTVLICAGMKVFPEEVEEVINSMPGVRESFVFGQDHPQFGQVPVAHVTLDVGVTDPAAALANLRGYCMERLSSYKTPIDFRAVDALPKTASGKLARSGHLSASSS
ncbi:MAG TPA: class I adenylate-forming enzyme family protein [Tepidisphaeraceae bacterium]|jgi:long-chain acyl-CoA synthetase|nr:class I adenylate-forming enzyme family protein [Tepidisphaeraceae bacterium]